MDSLILMRNRKLFSKVDIKEVLIDEERIRMFEELGEERLKEERWPAEKTLKEWKDKENKWKSHFRSKKTFGMYTTRKVSAMSLDYTNDSA